MNMWLVHLKVGVHFSWFSLYKPCKYNWVNVSFKTIYISWYISMWRKTIVQLELKTWTSTFSNILSWNQQNIIKNFNRMENIFKIVL
jgi:hypothetical protein